MAANVFTAPTYVPVNYITQKPWGSSSGSQKVWCELLMKNITPDNTGPKPYTLKKSIFANAKDCEIAIPSTISTQGYMTVLPPLDGPYEQPNYDYMGKMIVETYDKDMQQCRLTCHVDNSTLH